MLSLSNYLTNRRETALISAYCFSPAESEHRLGVFLENRGAGGGTKKTQAAGAGRTTVLLQRDLADPGDTYVSQSPPPPHPTPPDPPSGTLSVSYGSLNACLPSEWK